MGMAASPSSSLNTPAAGGASPSGEEAAYREKVRQLSKYIEPLRRMVHRMVSEGESEYCYIIKVLERFLKGHITIHICGSLNHGFTKNVLRIQLSSLIYKQKSALCN